MIEGFILSLPAVVCLFWILSYTLTISRTYAYKPLLFLLLAAGLYFLADSFYGNPLATPQILTFSSLVTQLVGPSMIPLLMVYLHSVRTETPIKSVYMLWTLIPAVLFTVELLLVIMAGVDNIEGFLGDLYAQGAYASTGYRGYIVHSYYIWAILIFRIVILIEILIFAIVYIPIFIRERFRPKHLTGFLFHNRRISIIELSIYVLAATLVCCVLKVFLMRGELLQHRWIPLTISIVIALGNFLFCYVAQFSAKNQVRLRDMINGFRFNYRSANKSQIVEEMLSDLIEDASQDTLRRMSEKLGYKIAIEEPQPRPEAPAQEMGLAYSIFAATAGTWDEDSLIGKFEYLMQHEQMFLQPGLTLADVADRLGTNKTYISKLVNNTYNLAFPDLINTLRIDYAEQYLIKNRNAKQADIASECGFTSASTMNITFKKVTGMTPKIWLATHDRKQNS